MNGRLRNACMRPASRLGIVEMAKLAELHSASCDNGGRPFLLKSGQL